MSDISKKHKWMGNNLSDCGNFRLDCALGVELKTMRRARDLTLMQMSEDMGWSPAKLSKYENTVGALTDKDDARVIEHYLSRHSWAWREDAIALSNKTVRVDLSRARKKIADMRRDIGA